MQFNDKLDMILDDMEDKLSVKIVEQYLSVSFRAIMETVDHGAEQPYFDKYILPTLRHRELFDAIATVTAGLTIRKKQGLNNSIEEAVPMIQNAINVNMNKAPERDKVVVLRIFERELRNINRKELTDAALKITKQMMGDPARVNAAAL